MHQPAARTTNVAIAESGPTGFIQQTIPYAFAFALGNAPVLDTRMPLGKIVTVAVADGTRAPHVPHDWFAARVPVIPAVTGPVHVAGVRQGDILEIEVIALAANDSASIGPLLATVAVASDGAGRGADPVVQSTIPAGGVVRVAARQPGGLILFGPVVARQNRNGDPRGEPVAARMMVRCTVIQTQGS
jgi:hypothetical protein